MSIFGWSYPPGCHSVPGDEETHCAVCGKWVDDCICPECEACGQTGDPVCYERHGLVRTQEQIESLAAAEASWEAQAEAEYRAMMDANPNEE